MANINDHFNQSFARQGTKLINGAVSLPSIEKGTYVAVQFVTKCTPAFLTTHYEDGVEYGGGIVYPAGIVLYLDIRSIRLSAGEVAILYKRVPC